MRLIRRIYKVLYVTPAFFVMLAVSLVMWWLTQLSKEYSGVEVPVEVRVDGNIFTVECFAAGTGFELAALRTFRKPSVDAQFGELGVTAAGRGRGIIDPEALRRVIASRITEVSVERVGVVPEIKTTGR